MPFALVFVGLILIVSGVRNTQAALGQQITQDFTGSGNFVFWLASLGAVGALGYIPDLKKFSIAFMTLIIIVMILAQQKNGHGGFFSAFYAAINAGPTTPPSADASSSTSSDAASAAAGAATINTTANNLSSNIKTIGQQIQSVQQTSNTTANANFQKLGTVLSWFGL